MEISQEKKEKLLRNAEILRLKTELLIEACSDWLPAEEGNQNMEKRIRERKKSERTNGIPAVETVPTASLPLKKG